MEEKNCPFNTVKLKLNKIIGKPKEGIHSYRICDIAYLDVIITMILALFIQKAFCPKTEYYKVLLFLFILGIIIHRIFDVRTTVDRLIFE
tara:strand:+ start:631 stop:900 length:270 start_codon:yes stop_codon:yes gene_type:complete